MFRIICILLSLIFFSHTLIFADIMPVERKYDWRAQIFLANQVKGVGLVDSYQEDLTDISYVYDNALAAIAFMAMGNLGLAKEILDTLQSEIVVNQEGLPLESYNYPNGSGQGPTYCGNIAWLLQAYNIYQKLSRSRIYYSTQLKLANFLLSLQDPADGGLRGSRLEFWKSTEHNIIGYVALRNFSRLNGKSSMYSKVQKILAFLKGPAIWDGIRFNRGAQDAVRVTDVQALGVNLLGNSYSSALTWAEQNLKLIQPFFGSTVTGFDFNDDLDTVWLEGTLQMALAYYKIGNTEKGNFYFNETKKCFQIDGSLFLATNTGTASQWWILQPWRAIAPSCWFIFCNYKFNPLILY